MRVKRALSNYIVFNSITMLLSISTDRLEASLNIQDGRLLVKVVDRGRREAPFDSIDATQRRSSLGPMLACNDDVIAVVVIFS